MSNSLQVSEAEQIQVQVHTLKLYVFFWPPILAILAPCLRSDGVLPSNLLAPDGVIGNACEPFWIELRRRLRLGVFPSTASVARTPLQPRPRPAAWRQFQPNKPPFGPFYVSPDATSSCADWPGMGASPLLMDRVGTHLEVTAGIPGTRLRDVIRHVTQMSPKMGQSSPH
jgi:hypothetical protein